MTYSEKGKQLRELIRLLERRLGITDEDAVACCGVSMAQCHALVEIGRAETISLNELASLLSLDCSTMSRTVNNLVSNGLAKRNIDPKDRRYVAITLTVDGTNAFAAIEENMSLHYEKIARALPDDKRDQVLESVKILLDAYDRSACIEDEKCGDKLR